MAKQREVEQEPMPDPMEDFSAVWVLVRHHPYISDRERLRILAQLARVDDEPQE